MNRNELNELHYITPIANVPSILKHGILSFQRAEGITHQSVALVEVQQRRRKAVPGGRPLHEYVNLYLCARNPMLYLRHTHHLSLCVLRVSTDVLDLPRVVVADMNAASDYVRFGLAPQALSLVDRDLVFAESWIHTDDQIQEWRHKAIKCAEVLVPDRVLASFISGAYVSGSTALAVLRQAAPNLLVTVDAHLFFLE
jgi:hypothetical protein